MKRSRRRKTPETDIAARIRSYAAGYAANGQKEHAAGMIQAADLVDEMIRREGRPTPATNETSAPMAIDLAGLDRTMLEERLRQLEARLTKLEEHTPRANPERKRNGQSAPAVVMGEAPLMPGEERILAAISQYGGLTFDQLTAIVGLRKTSLRTYLGNLRAAGYSLLVSGANVATPEGRERVNGHAGMPTGSALLESHLETLPAGEANVLRCIARQGSLAVSELVGATTGLQSTSVRTYLGELSRRKLTIRPSRGHVALAPILVDGWNRAS